MIMDVDMIRQVVLHSLEVVWDIIKCQFKQQYYNQSTYLHFFYLFIYLFIFFFFSVFIQA